jgi:hypothetical protein
MDAPRPLVSASTDKSNALHPQHSLASSITKMGFFKKDTPAPAPAPEPVYVEEKKGLFGRKSTVRRVDTDEAVLRRQSVDNRVVSPTVASHSSTHNPNQRLDEINSILPQACVVSIHYTQSRQIR